MSPKTSTMKFRTAALIGVVACLVSMGQNAAQETGGDAKVQPPASSQPAGGAAATETGKPASPSPADSNLRTPPQVSPEDLLREFQKDRPKAVPIMPAGSPDEEVVERDSVASPAGRRVPDGFFLVDRVGRLTREGEWWVFVFEGYHESHPEPPMKMLPNQLLERMVIESQGGASSTVFVVSGEVTEFKSENYLLLRKLLHRRNLGNLEK